MMCLFEVEFDSRLDVLSTHGKAGASASATSAAKQRLKKVAEAAAHAAPGTEEVAEVGVFDAPAFQPGGGEIGPAFQFSPSWS